MLSSGYTTDLFQLESAGMQRYIKELKPSNLGDIAAMIALYRPGPMENIEAFIEAKHGRAAVSYPHPSLKELLDETYGIIVYQDQVLLILQQFAGYSLGAADIVRKAMGKKIAALMAQERDNFVAGAQAKGFERELAVEIFDLIEPFAGYAFNKAHSVSYALISYWTGYFKTHYPVEYMAAVLNSRMDNTEKMVSSINECFRLGIPVLLPDINHSGEFFTIEPGHTGHTSDPDNANPGAGQPAPAGLRIGLAAVKSVGEGAVRPLVAERKENGPYESIDDFCRRAGAEGLNRRTMESLVQAGAFDALAPRGALLDALDAIVATAQREARTRASGQSSLFAGGDASSGGQLPGVALGTGDVSQEQKGAWERELLGVNLSHNPVMALASLDTGDAINSVDQIGSDLHGSQIRVVGYVSGKSERSTREGKTFLIVNLELLGGQLEVLVWPETLQRTAEVWREGRLTVISGKIRERGDQTSLVCDDAEEYGSHGPTNPAVPNTPDAVPARAANGDRNGNGDRHGNGHRGHEKDVPATAPTGNGSTGSQGQTRMVSLGVTESEDPAQDALLLREVIGVILEYPGRDRVNLNIKTAGKRVFMDLPVVSTGYCETLHQRLEELLGPNSVAVHHEMALGVDSTPF